MRVAVLGPVQAEGEDGTPIDIGGARLRMLLARLALDPGRPVPTEALVDGLWGAAPPADTANALQSLVSRLRKVLRPAGVPLDSTTGGYRLGLEREQVDAHRFEELAARGRHELGAGQDAAASATLRDALALWRGPAFADIADAPFAVAPAARWADLRIGAAEDRFEAELRLGRHAEILADLEDACAHHPLRERLARLRMGALYAAGRQSDALAVYEKLRATLADELGVDPSAEVRETHLAMLRGKPPIPEPARRTTDHLPVRLTSFVGREDELKLLGELLDQARLVTLVGPGGAGKTRLATEAASRSPCHESGRVWFVPLAGVRAGDDLPDAVLTALGVWELGLSEKPTMRRRPPPDALGRAADALGSGDALLVLDNCEHVVEDAARLAHDLLGRLPRLRILATSREPLAIDGEALCPLGPLAVPAGQTTVAEATGFAAVRLFLDRARTVRPDFSLTESTVDSVGEVCRRLDGMPLALELAAARLRSMTADQIARRLDDRFRLLTSGSRAALPRQRTLRAVVEWSWDLLDEPERVLARRLAVFSGGATIDAIEAVCADGGLPADDVLYVLGSLVEKSIVDTMSSERREPRYRMLETIRAYALERLADSGEREVLLGKSVEYYVGLAIRLEPTLRTADQLEAIGIFDAEHDNLRTALRWAIDHEQAEAASRMISSLFWYWLVRGFNDQVVAFLPDVLKQVDRLADPMAVTLQISHAMIMTMPAAVRVDNVKELADRAVASRALDLFPAMAIALPLLLFLHRELEPAEREIERAIAHPDTWARAAGYWVRGFLLGDSGDLEGAARARHRSLELFQSVGDRWGIAMTLAMQAESLSLKGDHARAIATLERGMRIAAELGSEEDVAQQGWRLALEHSRAGDHERAWEQIRLVEQVAKRSGRIELSTMAAFGTIEVAVRSGRIDIAEEVFRGLKGDTEKLRLDFAHLQEWVGLTEAAIELARDRPERVAEVLAPSVGSTAARGDMPDLAKAVELLALARKRLGRAEDSARLLGLAKAVRGAFDRGSPELKSLVTELTETLGEDRYIGLYDSMTGLSREDTVRLACEEFGVEPVDPEPLGAP